MKKQFLVFLFFTLSAFFVMAQPSHDAFNTLLKKYVSTDGKVNYKSFKSDKAALDSYINMLSDNAPQDSWSKSNKMVYWINAYNASTIKLILQNYPLSKITDLDGGKTWDVKRLSFGGKKLSLNDIENNILRPMGDAHFKAIA